MKHNNPCGCAVAASARWAYERAFACDPQSAYGGVIAVNRPVDLELAESLSRQFVEVLLAPSFAEDALAILTAKKNVRLLELRDWPARSAGVVEKPVLGGVLCQARDIVEQVPRADARGHREGADGGRVGRPPVRLEGLRARALERDRARAREARRSASARVR